MEEREFKIKGLMMDPIASSPIVILQDVQKNTLLPIWVGVFEANAIALQIDRIDTPRPMTHDLFKNMLFCHNPELFLYELIMDKNPPKKSKKTQKKPQIRDFRVFFFWSDRCSYYLSSHLAAKERVP